VTIREAVESEKKLEKSRIQMFGVVDPIRTFSRGAVACLFLTKELVVDSIADDNTTKELVSECLVSIGRVGRPSKHVY
jgi:hypothetical protein